ncbi:MAG TPA: GTPase HflX [Methylomirabilota bacterium]|nr:GTPase HflX [Methylomirabilota bacterium]
MVRARAGPGLDRRGGGRRRRGRGGRHRGEAEDGGSYRVSRPRRHASANGHGTRRGPERAVIAAMRLPRQRRWEVEESLEELAGLATAAGATVVHRVIQERQSPTPALYFGRGKVDEIGEAAREHGGNLLITDDALSPIQERNISQALGLKVIDRTALILDIFAQRARTAEGKLQVELAQLTYLLPRLVGQWSHLERLGGGIGTRGPGETQLESDRRVIRRRVMQVRGELEHVQSHRRLQREGRRRAGLPVVALVGYTNAGKTTLLNRLSGARLTAADQLFVTLDPAARLVRPAGARAFILTDTVGFIRKLPHELVAAFRATLEELKDADVLVHVVDASHPALEEHAEAVERILGELDVADRPTVFALNKVDRLDRAGMSLEAVVARRGGVAISAASGEGLPDLLKAIDAALPASGSVTLRIPHGDGAALALCYEHGRVVGRVDEPGSVVLDVELPPTWLGQLAAYRVLN